MTSARLNGEKASFLGQVRVWGRAGVTVGCGLLVRVRVRVWVWVSFWM